MKTMISEGLTSQAFKAANGELAWRREQVPEIVAEYARKGHAVEAFEVRLIDASGKWTGLIPVSSSEVPAVCVYDVEPQKKTETRESFVARCAQEILAKMREWNIEKDVPEDLRPLIRYNLYVAEEYDEQPA